MTKPDLPDQRLGDPSLEECKLNRRETLPESNLGRAAISVAPPAPGAAQEGAK
jgi:hypothetical protein